MLRPVVSGEVVEHGTGRDKCDEDDEHDEAAADAGPPSR
jgi:hypothetical protein